MSGKRKSPNILITGTPGTGKTTAAEMIASATGINHVNIGELVKQQELYSGWDDEYECHIIDEDKVCDALEDCMAAGGNIVDYHGCDFFPERWFDLVLVLQASTSVLYDRLQKRGYSEKKLSDNMECEIMNVIAEEAIDSYRREIVHLVPSNVVDDLENLVDMVASWVAQYSSS